MVNININNSPLPINVENKVKEHVVIRGNYGMLSKEEKENILNKLSNESISISIQVLDSIRSLYTKDKIIFRHEKLKRNINNLYSQFKSGKSIMELSQKYDFPPMAIVRQFLMEKYNKKEVKSLLKDPSKINNDRLRNDIKYIQDNNMDIFVTLDQSTVQEHAETFELDLGDFLRSNGVRFKTQDELSQEQIDEHGKPINTPDFLIESDLTINGEEVNWIDAKNFYGADAWMIKRSIHKQTKKYIDRWGKGVIWFSLGFSENLKINSVQFVSKGFSS